LQATEGSVSWTLTNVQGQALRSGQEAVDIGSRKDTLVTTLDFGEQLAQFGSRGMMLWFSLKIDDVVVSTNFVSFCRPKHLELATPGLTTRMEQVTPDTFLVTVESSRPALWAWLSLDQAEARYSDNFFHVVPGMPIVVDVIVDEPLSLAEFEAQLTVQSLIDTYA